MAAAVQLGHLALLRLQCSFTQNYLAQTIPDLTTLSEIPNTICSRLVFLTYTPKPKIGKTKGSMEADRIYSCRIELCTAT